MNPSHRPKEIEEVPSSSLQSHIEWSVALEIQSIATLQKKQRKGVLTNFAGLSAARSWIVCLWR